MLKLHMALVYKYLNSLAALEHMTLLASDPATFNDPFEVRPCFDQESQDAAVQHREVFEKAAYGDARAFTDAGSMFGFPAANVVGMAETYNATFRGDLSKRYRATCLSYSDSSVLMWAHYARMKEDVRADGSKGLGYDYSGVAIGIDTSHPEFATGLRPEGFKIRYCDDRAKIKLPSAFYQTPAVETYGIGTNGRLGLLNSANEEVMSNGIVIPFSQYRKQVEETMLKALTTKAACWGYEEEVRFLYDLNKHADSLRKAGPMDVVPLPPSALKEIIVGPRASTHTAQVVVDLYRAGKIGKPQLYFSDYHPYEYKVRKNECELDYLMDYYKIILPQHAPVSL